jgi:hypothetical protein
MVFRGSRLRIFLIRIAGDGERIHISTNISAQPTELNAFYDVLDFGVAAMDRASRSNDAISRSAIPREGFGKVLVKKGAV